MRPLVCGGAEAAHRRLGGNQRRPAVRRIQASGGAEGDSPGERRLSAPAAVAHSARLRPTTMAATASACTERTYRSRPSLIRPLWPRLGASSAQSPSPRAVRRPADCRLVYRHPCARSWPATPACRTTASSSWRTRGGPPARTLPCGATTAGRPSSSSASRSWSTCRRACVRGGSGIPVLRR